MLLYHINTKMKYLLVVVLLLISSSRLLSQSIIKIDKNYAVVFSDSIKVQLRIDSLSSRFYPSDVEVLMADSLVRSNKNRLTDEHLNRIISNSYRQFIGYIDLNNEKH